MKLTAKLTAAYMTLDTATYFLNGITSGTEFLAGVVCLGIAGALWFWSKR